MLGEVRFKADAVQNAAQALTREVLPGVTPGLFRTWLDRRFPDWLFDDALLDLRFLQVPGDLNDPPWI